MARFYSLVLAFFCGLLFVLSEVHAAPVERALGSLKCNAARLRTVAGLAATSGAVNKLSTAASGDAAASTAVTTAQSGLKDAQSGIATIAKALITGQAPPAASRDQVQAGLNNAQTALTGINSTDATVTSGVQTALGSLSKTIAAGQDVVANC